MADLPVELWHSIFDHLELTNLLSCALVSKTLYSIVKAYRIRELAFTRRIYEWFHPDFSIYQHRVDYSMASLLKGSSFSLEYLRRLKIGRRSSIDDLNVINKFIHLEDLDLDLKNYKNEQSRTLSLANLKVLRLFMSEHLPYLKLDTPKLAEVYTFNLENLDFLHPHSVRCIRTFFHSGKLSMFRNLEYLTFTDRYNELDYSHVHSSKSFNEFEFASLMKLKEIAFFFGFIEFEMNNLHRIRKAITTILALRRPDLKVLWHDVQVTHPNLLTEFERWIRNGGSSVPFHLQHYEKLRDKVDFFWAYKFNSSMRKLLEAGFDLRSEEFTSKILAKYSFGRINVAHNVSEEELLLQLVARSPRLWSLNFENTNLTQSFFDQMADTIQLNGTPLRHFCFFSTSNESLNYDFVSKLRHLEWFGTNQPLSFKLIENLLTLPSITKIKFSSGKIELPSTNRFLLNKMPLSRQKLLSKLETPQ